MLTYLVIFSNYLEGFPQALGATHAMLRHLDLIEQIRMTIAAALGLSRRMVAYYEQGAKPIPRVVALATHALDAVSMK